MNKNTTNRIVTAGLLTAVGMILPWFTAHAFGVPGTILLPMHIPVLLCGLLCGPRYGAIIGVVLPLLSSLLTGMPAIYPMLPIMAVQLFAMGALSGLLRQTFRLPLFISLTASMASGWICYGLMYAVLMLQSAGNLRALSATAALIQGLPGIAIQLILIPLLLAALKRFRNGEASAEDDAPDALLEKAVSIIKSAEATCVVIRNGAIVHTASGRGVSPVLKLYREEPEKLHNARIADKIIGKAAAMILVLGGAVCVYGEIMSAAALAYLDAQGIEARYGRCVDVISSRDGKGICPIEKSVLETDDPKEGLIRIEAAIAELMKSVG